MKACLTCMSGLTSSQDDGTGRHKVCPELGDREAYLARRRERMPGLIELHERLAEEMDVDNVTGT